jgi:hypothetical protein
LIGVTGTLLLAASLALLPARAAAQTAGPATGPTSRLSLLDVPYLSQTEALCGGAAAAMVLRYWGAAGVAAEEFAPLVDAAKRGIHTSVLARAVQERGYQAHATTGTAEIVRRELTDGRPVIALIEDRPGAFHYVVIVGWHARAVVLHDPARTPYVLMKPEDFDRRWKTTRNWMLAVTPPRLGVPARSPDSESQLGIPAQSGCDGLVRGGVQLAQQNDLAGAERLLADAAYQCPDAAPLRELAGVRLLQRRWPEVRDLAERAVEIDAADAHAWRLLATARYISGDQAGALDAWNRAGEPRVDLVSVAGLQRTAHRVVEQVLGIETGSVLTRSRSERARRRLDELPAAARTALEYVPHGSGNVEVRAHVVERTVLPHGLLTWAAAGLRAAASREIGASISGLGHGGERIDLSWRFWPNRPAGGVALHLPATIGLVSLDVVAERQAFDVAALPDAERLTTRVRAANWATPALRWEMRGGFARWRGAGSFGTIGAATRFERGVARAGAEADLWLGDPSFATGLVHAGWRSSGSRRGFVIDLSSVIEAAATGAPLDLWPAGDTGQARRTLLRAHPLLDDGRLRIERLGRHLLQATAEAQHWWRAARVAPIGAAIFIDAARVTRRPSSAPARALGDVDVGAGFRLAFPGREGTFRADVAHGLRDGRNAFSISWTPE